MKRPVTKKELKELLNALGRDPEQIRRALRRRKIKGSREESTSCPIANYLKKKLEKRGCSYVSVDGADIKAGVSEKAYNVYWKEYFDEFKGVEVNTPSAAQDFIANFDEGLYPE